MTEMKATVHNNSALSRYELDTGEGIAVANYHASPGVLTFHHTEVPRQLRGHGVASRLVHDALEQVRAEGLKIVPRCDFVRHYVESHPEFSDLLA